MNIDQRSETMTSDYTPAVPLEISSELAAAADEILRDFAEDGELDMALVVDQSGALVTGISSEAEVMVEVISALVAGASGAMRALVGELGETGDLETLLQGDDRVVYLSELANAFVLVGVCTAPTPVAIIREKANQVRPRLDELLNEIERPEPEPKEEPRPAVHSLRALALERAAAREAEVIEEEAEDAEEPIAEDEVAEAPVEEESVEGEIGELEEEHFSEEAEESVEQPEEMPESDPVEIIETLGGDEPEIVIEESAPKVIDSPFEVEEEEEDVGGGEQVSEEVAVEEPPVLGDPVESIFELEEIEEEEAPSDPGEERVESEPEAEEEMSIDGQAAHHSGGVEETTGNIFEIDEEAEEDVESIFEADEESEEDQEAPEVQEGEEPEIKSSGPFYF